MHLAGTGGADLLCAAEERGTGLLVQRLLYEIDQQRAALLRPSQESERRIAAMRACVADAEQALNDLAPLFTAEQKRLSRACAEQWKRFLVEATPAARTEFARAMRDMRGSRSAVRQQGIRLAQQMAPYLRDLSDWLRRGAYRAKPARRTLQTCVGCHATYRQEVVDEATWKRLAAEAGAAH